MTSDMHPQQVKNIIFDWSGTLLNNFDVIYKISMDMFVELGGQPISKDVYRNENVSEYMKFWNKHFPNLTKEQQDRMFSSGMKSSPVPQLYPKVPETLRQLQSNGHRLYLVSSQPDEVLNNQVRSVGILDCFTYIVGGVFDKKTGIEHLVNNQKLAPEATWSVGDTVDEVIAGKQVSIKTFAVTWGFHSRSQLEAVRPDYIADDLSPLVGVVGSDL